MLVSFLCVNVYKSRNKLSAILAGAFFLALVLDNNFGWFEY